MSWQDQGRQYHQWFGHGLSAHDADQSGTRREASPGAVRQRAFAAAYGAIGALPAGLRRNAEAQFQRGTLNRMIDAMVGWVAAALIRQASDNGISDARQTIRWSDMPWL